MTVFIKGMGKEGEQERSGTKAVLEIFMSPNSYQRIKTSPKK